MDRPPVYRTLALLLALPVAFAHAGAAAQSMRGGVVSGKVQTASGDGVDRAVVRIARGATIYLAETDADGSYRIDGLPLGRHQLSVRREGFGSLAFEVDVPGAGIRRDFTLTEAQQVLDPALVAERWTGVRGVVADSRSNVTLAGASLGMLGAGEAASTDSAGHFAIPLPPGKEFVLRIGRTGYATRLLTGRTPKEGYLVVDIPLDTTEDSGADYWIWRDLERRLKYATPRAAHMTRAEIVASGAASLGGAIDGSQAITGRGLFVPANACLFVDGLPQPGGTIDAIRSDDVEFVEAYPMGTDLTRTLASRWPPNAVCGAGGLTRKPVEPRSAVQYVVVWLRAP